MVSYDVAHSFDCSNDWFHFRIGGIAVNQNPIKLAYILAIIGLICAGIIAIVHEITIPIIEKRSWLEKQQNFETFFEGVTRFEEVQINEEKCKSLTTVYHLYDRNDMNIGDVYELKTKGYGGDIQLLVAYDTQTQTLLQLSYIGSFNETPGFGSRVKEDEFLSQITHRFVEEVEINTLTGATITSTAIKDAVEEANSYFLNQESKK